MRHFKTARQLARQVGVSKVNAYRIIKTIADRRLVELKRVRESDTGPLAIAYRLVR